MNNIPISEKIPELDIAIKAAIEAGDAVLKIYQKVVNDLLNEAFIRSQKDLHVLHFFIPVESKLSSEDTGKAYKAISKLYTALAAGKTDYTNIIDTEQIKITYNDLGFITVFTLPYEYETLIYNLKMGKVATSKSAKL